MYAHHRSPGHDVKSCKAFKNILLQLYDYDGLFEEDDLMEEDSILSSPITIQPSFPLPIFEINM
ncbi:hypothetical protein KI387_020383, partial [Taxus chinensis]